MLAQPARGDPASPHDPGHRKRGNLSLKISDPRSRQATPAWSRVWPGNSRKRNLKNEGAGWWPVRISLEASPEMVGTRAMRSAEPNAVASDEERFASSSGDAAITLVANHRSRTRRACLDANSRVNCNRRALGSKSRDLLRGETCHVLSAIAVVTLPRAAPFASPKRMVLGDPSVMAPSPRPRPARRAR